MAIWLWPGAACCRGRQVAFDVVEALDYLHTHLKVMHSDLKSRWGACGVVAQPACRTPTLTAPSHPCIACPLPACCTGDAANAAEMCEHGRVDAGSNCPLLSMPAGTHWLGLPACMPACLPPACSNVLLSGDLRASIADLGVAQALASTARSAAGFTRASAGACIMAAHVHSEELIELG